MMSDNKKYYYLKLKDNFFDTDEMIVLESMTDGMVYSNILLKLYLRSLKYEGRLMFNDRIPFNSQMLANVTRHSVGDVEKAVSLFKELGLIEIMDTGAIYITDIQNFIGKSTTEADRKRQYRNRIEQEKQFGIDVGQEPDKCLTNTKTNVGQMSDKCPDKTPPELEIEIEKELEKELELEVVQNDKKLVDDCKTTSSFKKFNIFNFIQANFNRVLSPIEMETLNFWLKEFDKELIQEATRMAVMNNKYNLKYIEAILKNWERNNITTVAMAREEDEKWRSRQNKISKSFSSNRKETLPDWAEKEMTETPLGHEEEMQLKKQLEELRAK